MLLTTGEPAVAVLPRRPSRDAVVDRRRRVWQHSLRRPRRVHPRRRPAARELHSAARGPGVLPRRTARPDTCSGVGDDDNLVVFRLGSRGRDVESYGGLFTGSYPTGFAYSAGYVLREHGRGHRPAPIPTTPLPDRPVRLHQLHAGAPQREPRDDAVPELRSNAGPILRMLDTTTFTTVGSVTLPTALQRQQWIDFAYLGGDAVAMLGLRHAAADHARAAHRLPALRSARHDVADRGRNKRRAQQREA